jgi:hypothetical protein
MAKPAKPLSCQFETAARGPEGTLVLARLRDDSQTAMVRRVVKELTCDDSPSSRFPGPNPVSLDTGHFSTLRGQPYYLCEKTDGVRYLLLACTLTLVSGAVKLLALIDRAFGVYILPLARVPKAMFQGSVLDGELVWNKAERRWDYLVFDAVTVSGIPVMNCTLPDRLRAVHKALGAYSPDPADPVRLGVKTFVPCSKMDEARAHVRRAEATYDTDGVILTPGRPGVVYGRHLGMFKLKFGSRHTIDFLVGADGRALCVFDAGRHVQVGTLRETARPGSVVECGVPEGSPGPGRDAVWDLVMVRTDKTTANDMFTYQKTLLNMRENLGLDDLGRVFG